MLRGALVTPIRSTDAAGTLVIGTLLTALGWIVVPLWLVAVIVFPAAALAAPLALAPTLVARGYFLRVIADGIETGNADGAPRFVRWGGLYRDGVKSAFVTLGYLLPLSLCLGAVALAGVLLGSGRVDPIPGTEPTLGSGTADPAVGLPILATTGGFVALFTLTYLLAFAYLQPAALSTLAASGRLRDAFRPTIVGPVAASGDYVVGWSLAAVVLLTGYTLAIPFVPLLVGISLVFLTRVVAYALYGRVTAGALGEDDTPDPNETNTQHDLAEVARGLDASVSARRARAHPDPPEAPPDVQTGRSVPSSARSDAPHDRGGADERDCFGSGPPRHADGDGEVDGDGDGEVDADADDGGFRWGPRIDG